MPKRVRVALAVLLLLAVPAGVPAKGRKGSKVVTVTIGPFPIEPNRDREVCRAVRVPALAGMQIDSWEARVRTSRRGTVGSHHFVVYGYSGSDSARFPAASALLDDPGCVGLGPADFFKRRVFLGGSGGEPLRGRWAITNGSWPAGVTQVMPTPADLGGDAIVVLNSHYFNASSKAGQGFARFTMRLSPREPARRPLTQVIEVLASRGIKVAPNTTGPQVTATWAADGARNESTEGGLNPSGDVCVFALSPHMHKRGVLYTIDYEEDGKPSKRLHTTTDYLHPGNVLLPTLVAGTQGLLRGYSAENGHPRIRYTCLQANGVEGKEMKMGCEAVAGEVPGRSAEELYAQDPHRLGLEDHARPCGLDGVNCEGHGTGRCVPANLVFGPLSDDDMCVLTALVYEPRRDVPPEQACNPNL